VRVLQRRLIFVLVCVGAPLGLLVGFNTFRAHMIQQTVAQNAAPAQVVTTATAAYSDWQPEIETIGSLRAVHGVNVTTEVAGLVRRVNFRSGDEAHDGQILVELNADSDIAQLQALQATAEFAETVYARDQAQYNEQAISKAQFDAAAADLKNRRAQVVSQAALVAKKTLRAPFAGRLGITLVNPGQYLSPGDKVVSLQSIDPIYVDFKVPQQQLPRVAVGAELHLTVDALPGQIFKGKVTAIDSLVDSGTRNFQVEGLLANPRRRLLPGMFGRVIVNSGVLQQYLTLPQTAVTYNAYGATIFLARKSSSNVLVAQQTFVNVGPTRGDQVAILRGIEAGDVVVTSGQMKLKNGITLEIDNRVLPSDDPIPTPQEE